MIGDQLASGAKKAVFFPPKSPVSLHNSPSTEDLDTVSDPKSDSHVPQLVAAPRVQFKGKPRGDMVLVIRVERSSSSLLVVPDVAKGKSEIGKIVGVGEKVHDLHEGDLVLYDRYAAEGGDIKLVTASGEVDHLMLREADVLLTLEETGS